MARKVLVVEDDDDIRTQLKFALELENYDVMLASNGKKALELLLKLKPEDLPSCILLDLMMPEMNGETFLETVQRDYQKELGKIKIIIATAKGNAIPNTILSKVAGKIQKPMELDELYGILEKNCPPA